eukprot:10723754-Karenia_brevis.AAC.1
MSLPKINDEQSRGGKQNSDQFCIHKLGNPLDPRVGLLNVDPEFASLPSSVIRAAADDIKAMELASLRRCAHLLEACKGHCIVVQLHTIDTPDIWMISSKSEAFGHSSTSAASFMKDGVVRACVGQETALI